MSNRAATTTDWRESRRRSARESIVDAAWALVGEKGLTALSLRDLARRAGITTPTVYAYFDSKNDIYDAMFAQAATQFADRMSDPYDSDDPREVLVSGVRRFVEFCTSDTARYQLLFQRAIPGFEPSAESYAPAVRALDGARQRLARNGITEARHLDLWTALLTGLVDQQVSNDPGGQRWTRLIEDAVAMFLAHCRPTPAVAKRTSRSSRSKGARS
jgi:AcrR family transcriptional regulator